MRALALSALAVAVTLGLVALFTTTAQHPSRRGASLLTEPLRVAVPPPSSTPPEPSHPTASEVATVARAWVMARFTRGSGDGPFAWLSSVAPLTDPAFLTRLRDGRPTLEDEDILASRVEIDGVYASAVDPETVTVTCTVEQSTRRATSSVPCAVTLRVEAEPDGSLLVVDEQ